MMEFGKRAASEREYLKSLGHDRVGESNPRPNPVFDETGELVLYATVFGILIRSVQTV